MKICKPLYKDSLLQVANSVRAFIKLKPHHSTCRAIEEWIEKEQIEQIVLYLIDGMGASQVQEILAEDGFFRKYNNHAIQSVMPSTTVAATTCLRTGLTPAQSKYLGWHQYQEKIGDSVTMFRSTSYYQDTSYPDYISSTYPFQSMVEEASFIGIDACELFPYWKGSDIHSIEQLCAASLHALKQGKRFVYSYWDEYDEHMHYQGVHASTSCQMLCHIEESIAKMSEALPAHCGVIVLADHGHVDVENHSLLNYPEIVNCFAHPPTLEMRCANFYIKEDCLERFPHLFHQYFKDSFILYTHKEVIEEKLFGNLDDDITWSNEVGEFVAIAIKKDNLTCGENYATQIKGNHAGMSEEEMMVPLILYPASKK